MEYVTWTDFDEGAAQEKDSSASAIAAAGMIALSRAAFSPTTPTAPAMKARRAGSSRRSRRTMSATILGPRGALVALDRPSTDGLGIDEYCIWGDFFYTEALMRLHTAWTPYW